MRTIVTGGAGFIGSHLAEALLGAGHEVLVVDNLVTGKRDNVPSAADFAQVDVSTAEVERVIDSFRPEALFHLAAQADVRRSVADPAYDAQVNVMGTARVASAAARAGCRTLVFSSTGGAIYGEQDYFPADEAHPTRPLSPYGLSKLCGELYLGLYMRSAPLRAVALRYANVYGPRQDPHGEAGVVAIFCGKILADEGITIYGDGKQTRDYVHVSDVVRANLLALEKADAHGSFNIGTGVETDVNAIAEHLFRAAGKHTGARYGTKRPGEQLRSVIDPRRAKCDLGWKAEIDIATGLAETYRWFAERLDARLRGHDVTGRV